LTNVKVARRATSEDLLKELLSPPQRKGALEIKKYANTHFVNVVVEKSFYEEFEKTSSELGVPTEISVLKALEDHHEKMKKALELKSPKRRQATKMRKGKIHLEEPPKGITEIHENEDTVRIQIDRKFYTQTGEDGGEAWNNA
jgi:hypothetical protein